MKQKTLHQIEFYNEAGESFSCEEELTAFASACLTKIHPDFPAVICITVTDNEAIQQVNSAQRGIDRPTDVLSFPMLFYCEPEVPAEPITDKDYDPELQKVFLGDILVSCEKVCEQAEKYGNTFLGELCYLTLHGILHLFGYDHMTDLDKAVMRQREKEILAELGVMG